MIMMTMLHNAVAPEEAVGTGHRPLPESARRRGLPPPWPLLAGGLLVAALLASSRFDGRRGAAGAGAGAAAIPAARRREVVAPGPARPFRDYDEVARIPDHQAGNSSVYEQLWPGYSLKRWACKTPEFRDVRPADGRSVCFVHVGKVCPLFNFSSVTPLSHLTEPCLCFGKTAGNSVG